MNNFIYTVAVSYVPLHEKAVEIATAVRPVEIGQGKARRLVTPASVQMEKALGRGQLGFKRNYVRC